MHKSVMFVCKFEDLIVVRNRNKNTLKSQWNIALNKNDDIGGSQVPVKCLCISITMPLAKIYRNYVQSQNGAITIYFVQR